VKFNESKKRESISRHIEDKYRNILSNKSIDSSRIQSKTKLQEEELERLMKYEQELMQKNTESLQASQVMKNRYNQVFINSNSSTTQSSRSRVLPEIRARTNNSSANSHLHLSEV